MDTVGCERPRAAQDSNILSIADLHDKSARTLIYGLDYANNALHEYIDEVKGDSPVLKYGAVAHKGRISFAPLPVLSLRRVDEDAVKSNKDFAPNYRCCPEYCTMSFAVFHNGRRLPYRLGRLS